MLASLAAIPYFWRRVDEEIRLRVQGIFASHYSKFDVYVRSAQLVEGKGIEVRGLSIRERNNMSPAPIAITNTAAMRRKGRVRRTR